MARVSLPPGFRFHPTDVELIMYYLKRKIMGMKVQFEAIAELNIYKFLPWDLKDKSCLRNKDLEAFFFCPREKKYASGARTNRSTPGGYWKTTGKDRTVVYNGRTVGMVKTLVFHHGQAPQGERTDWVMHEYRLEDKDLADARVVQDAYVLCKVFKKNGRGPQNGAQYGAPFNEDDYNEEGICCADSSSSAVEDGVAANLVLVPDIPNVTSSSLTMIGPAVSNMNSGGPSPEPGPSSTAGPSVNEDVAAGNLSGGGWFSEPGPSSGPSVNDKVSADSDADMNSLLAIFTVEGTSPLQFGNSEDLEALNPQEENITSDGNDIYNGLGDLDGHIIHSLSNSGGYNVLEEELYGSNPHHILVDDDNMTFLELNDLNSSIRPHSVAEVARCHAAAAHLQTVSSSSFAALYDGFDVNSKIYSENNILGTTVAAQNGSGLNELPPLPESLGNHFDLLEENAIRSRANQEEFTAARDIYFSPRRVEGSSRASSSQALTRGEKERKPVINGGSSINIKAEVSPRIDGCTKDALSPNLEEFSSTTMWKKTATSSWPFYNLHLEMISVFRIGLLSCVFRTSFCSESGANLYFWNGFIISNFNQLICTNILTSLTALNLIKNLGLDPISVVFFLVLLN